MSESKTSERMLTAVERKRQALELRKAGATYPQIMSALGYKSTSGAFKAVMSAIRAVLREPAEEVRELELARCDEMLRALWPGVLNGDPKKIMAALHVMERRAKYQGLDAPIRIDVADEIMRAALDAGLTEDEAKETARVADAWIRSHTP